MKSNAPRLVGTWYQTYRDDGSKGWLVLHDGIGGEMWVYNSASKTMHKNRDLLVDFLFGSGELEFKPLSEREAEDAMKTDKRPPKDMLDW